MPTTTNREAILSDVASVLAAIAQPTYRTNVARVEAVPRTETWTTISPTDRPYIGIFSGPERKQYLPGGTIRCTYQMILNVFTQSSSADQKSADMANLEDDILVALMADPRRNGNATETLVTEVDVDAISDQPQGYMRVLVECVYFRSTGQS